MTITRGMASWGVLIGLSGFDYHGPKQQIGFAPRLHADAFRCVFTGAAGWGTLDQQRTGNTQVSRIALTWGVLNVATLTLELPAGRTVRACRVKIGATEQEANVAQSGTRITVALANPVQLQSGEALEVTTTV